MNKPNTDPAGIPQEPSANMRGLARNLREIYVALIAEGFATHEAIAIIGQILSAHQRRTDD